MCMLDLAVLPITERRYGLALLFWCSLRPQEMREEGR